MDYIKSGFVVPSGPFAGLIGLGQAKDATSQKSLPTDGATRAMRSSWVGCPLALKLSLRASDNAHAWYDSCMTILPGHIPSDSISIDASASTSIAAKMLLPPEKAQAIASAFGAFQRMAEVTNRVRKASICETMERCFLEFLNKHLDPELAIHVESMLARFEGLSAAELAQARRWRNTLAFSRNPTKVGRDLAQAKVLFGLQFADVAAILLADRLDAAHSRESQSQSDGFDEERQCLALAIKACKGAKQCWALLSVGSAAKMMDVELAKHLIKEGFPVAGANAMGQAPIGMFAGSRALWRGDPVDRAEAMLALLLSHGAGANESYGADARMRFSNLPLRQAQLAFKWSLADKLMDAGADGFAQESLEAACILEQLAADARCPLALKSQAILDQRDLAADISLPKAPESARKPRVL